MIYVLCILLPPLALLLKGRLLSALLNVLLLLLFWIPAVVHAWVVIARMERDERDRRLAAMMRGEPLPPPAAARLGGIFGVAALVVLLGLVGGLAWIALQGFLGA